MATRSFSRSLPQTQTLLASFLSRSLSTATSTSHSRPTLSLIHRLRPLSGRVSPAAVRCLATNTTSSSLRDPNPNWSNRPPKETILLDGCDFEHWLVVLEKPEGEPTREDIIDSYIKTLAMVVGSEEEARMKIYSVSTRCYYAFGALVSEELSYKIKELPKVRWVLPDSYLDVKNKDYGGEPFINGQAVPYDPKYHEEWIRNNSRADWRHNRPRNFDRPRRREDMRNRDFQNRQNPGPNMARPTNHMNTPNNNMTPPNNYNSVQPSNNWGGGQPNNYNQMPHNSYNQMLPNNMGGAQPNNMGGVPPNVGWSGPGQCQNNYMPGRNSGGIPVGSNHYPV